MTTFYLLGNHLTAAEGETVVRTYHCTSLKSRLLSLNAEGFLTVTNKRVVFYAFGASYGGESVLASEVPIEDVSGINSYKGTYLSIMHLLGAILASFFISIILSSLLNIISSITSLISSSTNPQIVLLILAVVIGLASFAFSEDRIFRPILAATSSLLLLESSGFSLISNLTRSIFSGGGSSFLPALEIILGIIFGIFAIVSIFRYARRETMSLSVGSKGGSNTPISISGLSSFSFFNTAAFKALSAEPAEDAESLIQQLGAIVLDVQSLGDQGIKKWQTQKPSPMSAYK